MHGAARAYRPGSRPLRMTALVLLLVLTGCSAFSLAWSYVDGVLVDRVDDWVALKPAQRTDLQRQLEPWLDRIAVERMPGYTDFLRAAAVRTRSELTAADVQWAYRGVKTRYEALMGAAIDGWLAQVLAATDKDQRRYLRQRMQTENAAYRERYVDVSHRASQRALAERMIDFVEGWVGPLDVHQTQLLYRGVRELPDTSAEWYRYRTRMQAGLLALLRRDAEAAEVAAWMRGWWVDRAALRPHERAAFDRFRAGLIDLLTEFAATLTPLQRLAIGRRLRGIANELESIHYLTVRG